MHLASLSLDALWVFYDACSADPVLKKRIDAELESRLPASNKFSREYLYSVNIVGKKALIIFFKPASEAFETYGRKVIVNLVLDNETTALLSENYKSKPAIRTKGILKAESLVLEGITDEQRKLLKTQGFSTGDVMLCEWE